MRRSTADELRILSRRCKVSELILRGTTNHLEICQQLGMDPGQRSTITRDVAAIKEQWRESALRDFDEARGRELEKLALVEKEAWLAWERSKEEGSRKRTTPDGEETVKEKRDGNAAFLEAVLKCIAKRCALLGLDSPLKVAPTTPDGQSPWTPALKELTDDELAVMEKLYERTRQVAGGQFLKPRPLRAPPMKAAALPPPE
jgi:hypothetical protein